MTEAISGRRVRFSDLATGVTLENAKSMACHFRRNRPGGALVRVPEAFARERFNADRAFLVARQSEIAPDGVISILESEDLAAIPLKRYAPIRSEACFMPVSLGRVVPVRLRDGGEVQLLALDSHDQRVRSVLEIMRDGLSEGAAMRLAGRWVEVPSYMVNRVAAAMSLLTGIPCAALGYDTYQANREISRAHMDGSRWVEDQLVGNARFVEALGNIGITKFWFSGSLGQVDPVFGSRLCFDSAESDRCLGEDNPTAPGVSVASGNTPLLPLVLEIRQQG